MKDEFMAKHPESPFIDGRVPGFEGLRYFAIDPKYKVPAILVRIDPPQYAYLRTNRDNQAEMRHLGDLRFELRGKEYRLRVYHAPGSASTAVFVPFRDRTSGAETYGPGRYLTFDLNEGDAYEIDFNRAFNPYCAYTDAYECGFPPPENDLPVRIPVGEKVWSDDRNPSAPETAVREMTARALQKPPPRTATLVTRRSRINAKGSKTIPRRSRRSK